MNTLELGEKLEFGEFVEYMKNNMFTNDPDMASRTEIAVNEVTKNNGVHLTGLTIRLDDKNICPTIYLNNLYEDYIGGRSISYCLSRLRFSFNESELETNMDMSFFENFETVKDNLSFRVVNAELNAETLPDIPYFTFGDLAITFAVDIENKNHNMSGFVRVTNQHVSMWNVTEKEVFDAALKNECENNRYTIQSMLEVICGDDYEEAMEELPENWEKADQGMYVLSNTDARYGATGIMRADILEEHAKNIGDSFYILPSSIHEIILVSGVMKDCTSAEKFIEMVKEINKERLDPEEVLSNNAYFYDKDEKKIYRMDTKEPMYVKSHMPSIKFLFHSSELKTQGKTTIKEKMAEYKEVVKKTEISTKKTASEHKKDSVRE